MNTNIETIKTKKIVQQFNYEKNDEGTITVLGMSIKKSQ